MATSDLLNELQKDSFKAEGDMERRLCTAVVTQLEDASADISGLAFKWCGRGHMPAPMGPAADGGWAQHAVLPISRAFRHVAAPGTPLGAVLGCVRGHCVLGTCKYELRPCVISAAGACQPSKLPQGSESGAQLRQGVEACHPRLDLKAHVDLKPCLDLKPCHD